MKTLIVEDSATLCAIYAQYLDGSGLEVDSVETLSAARESLAKADVQLVLLDIELPDGNGLDLIDDLQRLSPQPAVVVMTGHGADYAEQAIARGADDFLNKPFDAARLRVRATLDEAAERARLEGSLRTRLRDASLGSVMRDALRLSGLGGEPLALLADDAARRAPWGFEHSLAAIADVAAWIDTETVEPRAAFAAKASIANVKYSFGSGAGLMNAGRVESEFLAWLPAALRRAP